MRSCEPKASTQNVPKSRKLWKALIVATQVSLQVARCFMCRDSTQGKSLSEATLRLLAELTGCSLEIVGPAGSRVQFAQLREEFGGENVPVKYDSCDH
jgi:hypothetical protein